MRKWLLAGISFGAIAAPAMAADMQPAPPFIKTPVTAPVVNWTGFYIGALMGAARAGGSMADTFFGLTASMSHTGFMAGGQVGSNYQVGSVVVGVEGNFDWTSLNATSNVGTLQGRTNTNWLTTAAARVGVAVDRLLFYGKAGAGWVGNSVSATNLATGASFSAFNTNSGWLVGGGLEWSFAPNWSTKVEYDYLGLRASNLTSTAFGDSFTLSRDIQTLTIGLNYTFGMYGYR
jgi:outer membrane immunogenic protein